MMRGSWGWVLAAGAVVFTQAGVDPPRGVAQLEGPSQGQIPAAAPASSPAGGGGGGTTPGPDYGPLILPIDGGNRRGVDAVGGSSPTPAGGGGGGGGGASFPGVDPDAPTQIGPWFLRFDPPVDRRNGTGPGGSPEATLAPGSPAPRR